MGSVTKWHKITHTVDGKSFAYKSILLILWPVHFTLFLKREKETKIYFWNVVILNPWEIIVLCGRYCYLSHFKFSTGHDNNLRNEAKWKEFNRIITETTFWQMQQVTSRPTFMLYSQIIRKKSTSVCGSGPWVAIYALDPETPCQQNTAYSQRMLLIILPSY